MASTAPDGCYRISVPGGDDLLTLKEGMSDPGTPVQLMPANGMGDQEWKVFPAGDATCTIMNVRSKTFLGFEGDPDHNVPVCGFSEPREWQLTPGERPDNFVIVPPGSELVLGRSPMRVHPPRAALVGSFGADTGWDFHLVGQAH